MEKSVLVAILMSAVGVSGVMPAYADENSSPFSAGLVVEWQNEYRANSDDPAIDETNHSFLRAELAPTVRLSDSFFIDGVVVFEPFEQVAEVNSGNDIWFDREGVFIEELKFNYEDGLYAVWAGKFNPVFGSGWDMERGIWGEDFAEDYEITEKLGVGGAYSFNSAALGAHSLSVTSFFADRSALSRGLITSRDDVSLSDGGASNTNGFSSFTVGLYGENLAGVENLGYQLGYRHLGEQSKNQDVTTDSEKGWEATLRYDYLLMPDVSLGLFGEYVGLRDFEGVKNSDRDYYTASVRAVIQNDWNVTAAYTLRDIKDDGAGNGFNDFLFQLSGGYDFGNGLTAELGWKETSEEDVDTTILGGLLRYSIDF